MAKENELGRGPWVKGIWSEWAAKSGINLPDITPLSCDLLANLNIHNRVLFSRDRKETLEHKFSLTVEDYLKEYDGKMPFWSRTYLKGHDDPILTAGRVKKLTGFIIEKNFEGYLDRLPDFFYSGAYILTSKNDSNHSRLDNMGFSCIEKELFRSRNKRLLVFRFLNNTGEVIRISSLRWDRDAKSKNVRVEDFNTESGWKVVKETTTDFEEGSHNLDNLVLSL